MRYGGWWQWCRALTRASNLRGSRADRGPVGFCGQPGLAAAAPNRPQLRRYAPVVDADALAVWLLLLVAVTDALALPVWLADAVAVTDAELVAVAVALSDGGSTAATGSTAHAASSSTAASAAILLSGRPPAAIWNARGLPMGRTCVRVGRQKGAERRNVPPRVSLVGDVGSGAPGARSNAARTPACVDGGLRSRNHPPAGRRGGGVASTRCQNHGGRPTGEAALPRPSRAPAHTKSAQGAESDVKPAAPSECPSVAFKGSGAAATVAQTTRRRVLSRPAAPTLPVTRTAEEPRNRRTRRRARSTHLCKI